MDDLRVCRTRRRYDVPPVTVFEALRDPTRLARWWGPAGFTNTVHRHEFLPGGRWELTMHGPDGRDYPSTFEYVEIREAERVRLRHLSDPRFELLIELAVAEGGTLLTWTQSFEDAAVAASLRAICVPANEQNLDRLAGELGAGHRPA